MSWTQWPPPTAMPGMPMASATVPTPAMPMAPAPAPVAAAAAAYPAAAASLDQWTQMQQQNWQQWAQWQQQYQQWHQQYGEEYQKMAALQQQQQLAATTVLPPAQQQLPLPILNATQPPPPPATEPKPPLPPDDPPAHATMPVKGYQTYTSAPPPLPPNTSAHTVAPGYSTIRPGLPPGYNLNTPPPPTQAQEQKPVVGPGYGYGYGPMQGGGYSSMPPPQHQPPPKQPPPPQQQQGGWNQQQQPQNKPPIPNQPQWGSDSQQQLQQQQQGNNSNKQNQNQQTTGSWENQQGRNSWCGNQQNEPRNMASRWSGGADTGGGGDGPGKANVGFNQQNQKQSTNNLQAPQSLLTLNVQKPPNFENVSPDFGNKNKMKEFGGGGNKNSDFEGKVLDFGATKSDFGTNKRPYQNQQPASDAKRNKMDVPPQQQSPQKQQQQNWQSDGDKGNKIAVTESVKDDNGEIIDPGKQQEIIDDMTEAERKFMKQFAEWEAQFNKWKEQNQDHPDKDQYKQYEKKWETWRNQLLERREQMRKKRLAAQMKIQVHHIQTAPIPPPTVAALPSEAQKAPVTPSISSPASNTSSTHSSQHTPQPLQPPPQNQPVQLPTNTIIHGGQPDFNRPPPYLNNEPLQFKSKVQAQTMPSGGMENVTDAVAQEGSHGGPVGTTAEASAVDPENEFLKTSTVPPSVGGIPGLDLGDEANKTSADVNKISCKSGPDLEALSKNINNILGDAKLLSMLSMVSQNKNIAPDAQQMVETVQNVQPTDQETTQQYEHNKKILHQQMQWIPTNYDEGRQQNLEVQQKNFGVPPPNFAGQVFHNNENRDNFRGSFNENRPNFNDNRPNFTENRSTFDQSSNIDFDDNRRNFNQNRGNFNENRRNFNDNCGSLNENRGNFNDFRNNFNDNRGNFNDSIGDFNENRGNCNENRGTLNENRGNFNENLLNFNENRGTINENLGNLNNNFNSSNRGSFNDKRDNFNDRSSFSENLTNFNDNFSNNFGTTFNSNFPPPQNWNNQQDRDKKLDNFIASNDNTNDFAQDNFNKLHEANKTEVLEAIVPQEVIAETKPEPEPEPEQELWSGKLIDYDHKSLKEAEPEVMIEPLQIFDYRHRAVNRIPLPERPKWLAEILKNARELDASLARPPYFQASDRPPNNFRNNRPPFQNYDKRVPNFDNRNSNFDRAPPIFDNRGSNFDNRGPNFDNRVGNFDNRSSSTFDNRGQSNFDRDSKGPNFANRPQNFHNRNNQQQQDDHKDIQDSFQAINSPDSFDNQRDLEEDAFQGTDKFNVRSNTSVPSKRPEFNLAQGSRFVANKEPMLDKDAPIFDIINPPPKAKDSSITYIKEILDVPGRFHRPPRIVIILRGPPGSGKTHFAKLIKDTEVEHGSSAPRILSLDDYFIVEQEKEVVEDGKTIKRKEMVYEFEEEMEESYRQSLLKAFKKTITDGYFPFIIVDNVNEKVKYFGEMWSFAKQNGFQVYVCTLDLDPIQCTRRNIHNRTAADIERIVFGWEKTPAHHPVLDASAYMKSDGSIPDVEMEDVDAMDNGAPDKAADDDDGDGGGTQQLLDDMDDACRSKWDTFDCSLNNLAKLDGTSKPLRHSTMQSYLQLDAEDDDDDFIQPEYVPGGKKRVRWADVEERKQQEKMREVGFVVGQTDWGRMMDPFRGAQALTHTKYIERTSRYSLHK